MGFMYDRLLLLLPDLSALIFDSPFMKTIGGQQQQKQPLFRLTPFFSRSLIRLDHLFACKFIAIKMYTNLYSNKIECIN